LEEKMDKKIGLRKACISGLLFKRKNSKEWKFLDESGITLRQYALTPVIYTAEDILATDYELKEMDD